MSTKSASSNRPLYLVGMMGVGKSTIGPCLADRLGRAFVDTDREVERATGRSIAEIFEQDGEGRFRELESEAIEAASIGDAVVALGGGAIAQPGVVERLERRGDIVFLSAAAEVLLERIGDASSRPLLAGLDREGQRARLASLESDRMIHYERATHRVDASGTAEEVVDRILAALQSG